VGDEALRFPLFMTDDGDIAFHGMAVDVHFDRVTRFASSDHRGPHRVSIGVGRVNGLSDLYLHDRNSRSLLPNVRSAMVERTATDMGGGGRPVPEGARSVVWACLLDDDGPTGLFFRDGRPLAW
jgi:hypothetical protein